MFILLLFTVVIIAFTKFFWLFLKLYAGSFKWSSILLYICLSYCDLPFHIENTKHVLFWKNSDIHKSKNSVMNLHRFTIWIQWLLIFYHTFKWNFDSLNLYFVCFEGEMQCKTQQVKRERLKSFGRRDLVFNFFFFFFNFSTSQELRRCSEPNCLHYSAGYCGSECCGPGCHCPRQHTENSHGRFWGGPKNVRHDFFLLSWAFSQ